MKRRRWKRWCGVAAVALLIALHALLEHALDESDAAAALLSPGGHVPTWALALMGLFLGVRLLVVLVLPGLVLAGIGMWVVRRISPRWAAPVDRLPRGIGTSKALFTP